MLLKKSFIGLKKTKLEYEALKGELPIPVFISGGTLDNENFNTLNLEALESISAHISGKPSFNVFTNSEKKINTIVICGCESDLLTITNQYVLRTKANEIDKGIKVLREATGVDNIVIVIPSHLESFCSSIQAEVKIVDNVYPSTLPQMISKDILGKIVPEGKTYEDVGLFFLSSETVAAIGGLALGKVSLNKLFTFINKDGNKTLVSAKIGTPINEILEHFNVKLEDMDRLIFGGPMRGICIYDTKHSILPDTDTVIVQDKSNVNFASDISCINCGECIRICPVKMPVNMLIRYLAGRQYEDGANMYDLYCCIECGLCSFVCVSKIPILQYIKLAKHELEHARKAEV
ncbi:MAG: electron transport complex protein RnfC [Desulfobacterales bacterium]|nr:electron transport complex protein RnfC [Desulfobacterales bacterium]